MVYDLDKFAEMSKELENSLIPKNKPLDKVKDLPQQFTGKIDHFQSPIKGAWLNLGAFSPGVATDVRHKSGHLGVDMMAARGTPIYPIAPGIARSAANEYGGPGAIIIDHGNGLSSYYAHCDSKIKNGQNVDYDTIIGAVNNLGNASTTYPHIHIEIRQNGSHVDPGKFFTVPAYDNKLIAQYEKDNPRNKSVALACELFYLRSKQNY